jgi:hypothetical protein
MAWKRRSTWVLSIELEEEEEGNLQKGFHSLTQVRSWSKKR